MHELLLTVSELTSLIKRTLEEGFYGLKVTGEISNFRPSSTGHWFFTLKDANSQISAVMFKGSTWKVDFTPPSEGDKVTVTGNLDVYGGHGGEPTKSSVRAWKKQDRERSLLCLRHARGFMLVRGGTLMNH